MWKGPLRPSRTATGYKLTTTDVDDHDDLFYGDGNLLISIAKEFNLLPCILSKILVAKIIRSVKIKK
jgi:hypothetical protein